MKAVIISILISVALVGVVIFISTENPLQKSKLTVNNVSFIDGRQIVILEAKGGYVPRKSVARAGIPTIIRLNTVNTFDCSSVIRIPGLNIYQVLPQTGSTDINIGTPEAGLFVGSCGMGMYPFEIDFKD